MHYRGNKMNGGLWKRMRKDEEESVGTWKVSIGEGRPCKNRRISDRVDCSSLGFSAGGRGERIWEKLPVFELSAAEALAARGEGVTRSLARDGWWREAGSAVPATSPSICCSALSPSLRALTPRTPLFSSQGRLAHPHWPRRPLGKYPNTTWMIDHCH